MWPLRTAAPKPVRRAGRRAYERVGVATAPMRLQPSFIMIGAERCGTMRSRGRRWSQPPGDCSRSITRRMTCGWPSCWTGQPSSPTDGVW
jgi:hypothetical protein